MRIKLPKFLRFCLVGGSNAVIYAIATSVFIGHFGLDESVASILGFCSAVPFSFYAHRSFTFSSTGLVGREMARFVATQLVSLATSVLAMSVSVAALGLHYYIGILAGIVFVPIVTFLVLNGWVFKEQAGGPKSRPVAKP